MKTKTVARSITLAIALVGFSVASHAAVILTVAQQSENVVFGYSGSLDTTGLAQLPVPTNGLGFFGVDVLRGETAMAFGVGVDLQRYSLHSFPAVSSFSTPGVIIFGATTGTGFSLFARGTIGLPFGYVSDDPLVGTLTLSNQTFASLGLVPGTYQRDLPSGDFIRLTIDDPSIVPIPEPATMFLLGGGLAGIGLRRYRRQLPSRHV